ncbi:MAG: hypothetical protein ACLP1X_01635 [Polyangiaceae bacterium]|jgi:hypothetical protein
MLGVMSTGETGGAAQGTPPRKTGVGCLAWGVGAGVVGVVLAVVVGSFIVRVARMERDIVRRGASAPGTAELRGLGCDPGTTVMESRQSWALDAGPPTETSVFIACLATEGKAVPTCDDVAREYAMAVHPAGKFVAQVRVVRRFKIECQKAYREDGSAMGDVAP